MNSEFDWLDQEILRIKSKRFHIFDHVDAAVCASKEASWPKNPVAPGDFTDFMKRFGRAHLFTNDWDVPKMAVYPLDPRRMRELDKTSLVEFGYLLDRSVFFKVEDLNGERCPVLEERAGGAIRVSSCFAEWFRDRYGLVRASYSESAWTRIERGPRPFSKREIKLVQARDQFSWSLVGLTDDGKVQFKVTNSSSSTLPYLTIGVVDKDECLLQGEIRVNVSHVGPGETKLIAQECYADLVHPSSLRFRDLPPPIPEKRRRYGELS